MIPKARLTTIAALVLVPTLLLSAPVYAGPPSIDTWTVMVYIDADNNLESYGWMNVEWLESVGSSELVNFVVLIDTYSGPATMLYIEQGSSTVLAQWGEVNMADPATMTAFMKAAKKAYPAQSYAFVTWDHGAGWRGLNWDDTSSEESGVPEYMDMSELRKAVADARIVWDVFAFDACLMAQPEVAYQMRDYAKYLVFSEETVYGEGFPYDAIARDLVDNPRMSARELAIMMVEDYAAYYGSLSWANDWTISAFDMEYMDDVAGAVSYLAEASLAVLDVYRSQFKNALSLTQEYYYPYYVDLMDYALNVYSNKQIKDASVKDAASVVISAVEDGVVLSINSDVNSDSHGLSIYFPSYKKSYLGLKAEYEQVPFAVDTGWLVWLQAFAGSK